MLEVTRSLPLAVLTSFSRTTNSQGAGHYFKCCRQAPQDFAVELNSDHVVLFYTSRDHLFRERVRHFVHAQMSPEIQTRCICQNSERTRLANRNYVEEAIVEFRSGSYFHSAAVVSRIGDAEFGDPHSALGI